MSKKLWLVIIKDDPCHFFACTAMICYNPSMNYSDYEEPEFEYEPEENRIDDDVLSIIIARAVLAADGVFKLAGGITDSISKTLLRKENLSKGIKINQNDEGIKIDVYIEVYYGVRIPDIAFTIQRNVKEKVQQAAERDVTAVNIHVQGVKNNEENHE